MTHASRELSRRIFDLVGPYETEMIYMKGVNGWQKYRIDEGIKPLLNNPQYPWYPLPNFAEVIRILPRLLGKPRDWYDRQDVKSWLRDILYNYMEAPTEPEGMAAVESYLMKLI